METGLDIQQTESGHHNDTCMSLMFVSLKRNKPRLESFKCLVVRTRADREDRIKIGTCPSMSRKSKEAEREKAG